MRGAHTAFIQKNPVFAEWAGESKFDCERSELEDFKTNYHPFRGVGTHKEAYARGLSKPAKLALGRLKTDNSAVFLLCGGDAPIDFILVKRTGTKKGCSASYGDAKHISKNAANSKFSTEATKVDRKAADVHPALKRELKTEFGLDLSDSYTTMIVTNSSKHKDSDQCTFLSPSTFSCFPWSNILFADSDTPRPDATS